MPNKWFKQPKVMVLIPIMLALLFALACGTAAPEAPETAPAAPDTAAPDTAAPGGGAAPDTAAQPTAVPEAMAEPEEAMTEVHPGKLTIMVGEFGNERFARTLGLGGGGDTAIRILHGFLLSENDTKELVPGIASEWGVSNDGLTWSFTIRKGVKFHDGSELTPEDVLWSLNHNFGFQAPEYSLHGSATRIANNLVAIDSNGPDQLSVSNETPEPGLPFSVSAMGPDLMHVMPKRAQIYDEEAALAYDRNPIGAGLMSLEKHVAADVMKFQRFDDFYYQPENGFPEDKRVNFQSLDMFLVPEEATRIAALRAGEADIVPVGLRAKKQVEAGGGRMIFGQEGVIIDIFQYGCYDPQFPCNDKRVRQALNYSFDKEVLRDKLFGGPEIFQIKGWSVITPSTVGYSTELDPWPFDPDKARQLLADAGYKTPTNPEGKDFGKLIVNTHTSLSMPNQVEAAQLGAEFWRKELGIDVEVRVSENVVRKKLEGSYGLNGQIWWRDNETRIDGAVGGVIANKYIDPEHKTRAHEDPEFFRTSRETWAILDAEKRAEALTKLWIEFRDESYNLGVGYLNIPWAVGPNVLTWEPYPLSISPSALHTITLK